jgi:hypothetical protein
MIRTSLPNQNLIGCSAKELREIKDYIRKLELELHATKGKLDRQRQARSLQLARALAGVRRRPLPALAECARVIFASRRVGVQTQSLLRHRGFVALDRRANPMVAAVSQLSHRTVLAEVAQRCSESTVATLRRCGPYPPSSGDDRHWIEVDPHDFELELAEVECPTLLIDPAGIDTGSPWAGVFGVQDMRLNLAMASLIELVRSQRGKVLFLKTDAAKKPVLLADFEQTGETVDAFADFERKRCL